MGPIGRRHIACRKGKVNVSSSSPQGVPSSLWLLHTSWVSSRGRRTAPSAQHNAQEISWVRFEQEWSSLARNGWGEAEVMRRKAVAREPLIHTVFSGCKGNLPWSAQTCQSGELWLGGNLGVIFHSSLSRESLLALYFIIAASGERLISLSPLRPVHSHPSCSHSIEKPTHFEFLISMLLTPIDLLLKGTFPRDLQLSASVNYSYFSFHILSSCYGLCLTL